MKSGWWFCARGAIVVVWAIGGIADRWPIPQLPASVSILICLLCFCWAALTTRFLVVLPYRKMPAGQVWLKPSWWISPFHAEQPFQFFHLTGYSFLLFGFAAGVRILMFSPVSPEGVPAEIYVGLFGLGILCGMGWALLAFRPQFVATTREVVAHTKATQASGINSVSSSG